MCNTSTGGKKNIIIFAVEYDEERTNIMPVLFPQKIVLAMQPFFWNFAKNIMTHSAFKVERCK